MAIATKASAPRGTMTVKDMLLEAIAETSQPRHGCSFNTIKKYLAANFQQETLHVIKSSMKKAIDKGEIVPVKEGTRSLSGSFKLPAGSKNRAVEKKSVPKAKPQKKAAEKKKTTVKVIPAKKGPKASADPGKVPVARATKKPTKKNVAPKKMAAEPKVVESDEEKENSRGSEEEEEGASSQSPKQTPSPARRATKKKALQESNSVDPDDDSGETQVKKSRPAVSKEPSAEIPDIASNDETDEDPEKEEHAAVAEKEEHVAVAEKEAATKKGRSKAPQSPRKRKAAVKAQPSEKSEAEDVFDGLKDKKQSRRMTSKN